MTFNDTVVESYKIALQSLSEGYTTTTSAHTICALIGRYLEAIIVHEAEIIKSGGGGDSIFGGEALTYLQQPPNRTCFPGNRSNFSGISDDCKLSSRLTYHTNNFSNNLRSFEPLDRQIIIHSLFNNNLTF